MELSHLGFRLKNQEIKDATWHPAQSYPLLLSRAKGSTVWDSQGKEYLDLCMGFGVLSLGHNPSYQGVLWDKIKEGQTLIHGMGDVFASKAKLDLIEKLLSFLPSTFSRLVFAFRVAGD